MRRAHTPAIPPKMYRHFAIVTVALTLSLAMFAKGENSEIAAAAAVKPKAAAAPAKPAIKRSARSSSQGANYWTGGEEEFDSGFGRPDTLLGGGGSFSPESLAAEEGGYSAEYLASLSNEERELLLKGMRENGLLSEDGRSARRGALIAASSRRSGAPYSDD